VIVPIAVACMVSLPIGQAFADDPPVDPPTTTEPAPDPTTTTEPAPDPTTTTLPTDPTSTTEPTSDPTSTTEPAAESTTTTGPAAAVPDLHPDEALVPVEAFITLTDGQRSLLRQLQGANDTFGTRRVALVGLARQLAAANDQLAAARTSEEAAVEREILGLTGAVVDRNDNGPQAKRVVTTSDAKRPKRAARRARAEVAAFDTLARRLASDRKSARRARVQAEERAASLKAVVDAQTKAVTDALDAKVAAEAAATRALGSDAVHGHADAITADLAVVQAGQTGPVVVDGITLPIPGAGLNSPFGIRVDPLGGGAGFHPGIDLNATSGTPIHAAAAGVVVVAGDCGGYGNCVVIDHGALVATVYGHQSQVLIRVGQHLEAGDVIGLVGSTGKSTGPHLHFEVRLQGIPIDPLPTLGD
jgi:murein DD-endopeptidase MepM/ murein hydrolase activator NlpD